MHAAQFVDSTTVMFIKILVAAFLGAFIGTERSVLAGQPAGTRTYSLVSLGACLLVITGNFVDAAYIGTVASFDPMHIAVGIVTGIGFIGGGIIFTRNESVHGVTTAAGLWIAAAVGIAVGFGMYAVSIFASIVALLIFTGMWFVEDTFKHWFAARIAAEQQKKTESGILSQ